METNEIFTAEWYASLPTKHVASGCVVLDGDDRVLLVKPTYKEPWELPGGGVEKNESPLEACRRELEEELGVDWMPSGFLGVDYRRAVDGKRGDALRFVFVRRATADELASIRLADAELSDWRMVDIEHLDDFVIPAMAARLRAMLGGSPYAEDGFDVLDRSGARRAP